MDTLRVLVSWECNLNCGYCCNKIPRFREQIQPIRFRDICWDYPNVCITGGEPLLRMDRVRRICEEARGAFRILYTNGKLLTPGNAHLLEHWGVSAVNVGLHDPASFDAVIEKVQRSLEDTQLLGRFHVQDIYEPLVRKHRDVAFRFWKMDDCERPNEDRVIVTDWQ